MKLSLIILSVIFLWTKPALAGRDGGGGSYERLLKRAGVNLVEHPSWNYEFISPEEIFLQASQRFLQKLAQTVGSGTTSFLDLEGAQATVTMEDVKRYQELLVELNRNKRALVVITNELDSMETGEPMTAVNIPSQKTVILNSWRFRHIATFPTKLMNAVFDAFAGHEILSLLGIEDVKNYAVSATILQQQKDAFELPYVIQFPLKLVCKNGGDKKTPLSTIEYTAYEKYAEFKAVDFTWPSDISTDPKVLKIDAYMGFEYSGPIGLATGYKDEMSGIEVQIWYFENIKNSPRGFNTTLLRLHSKTLIPGSRESFSLGKIQQWGCGIPKAK